MYNQLVETRSSVISLDTYSACIMYILAYFWYSFEIQLGHFRTLVLQLYSSKKKPSGDIIQYLKTGQNNVLNPSALSIKILNFLLMNIELEFKKKSQHHNSISNSATGLCR